MKLTMNTDICPIISVGMYGTTLAPDSMFTNWKSKYAETLSKAENEYISSNSMDSFNFQKYKEVISSYAMQSISDFFHDISGIVKVKLSNECEIYSPKYYNHETDELSFDIEVEDSEIKKITNMVVADNHFFIWAKSRYKSYDGFISFMPYSQAEFAKAINGKDIERAVAMCLTYILDRDFIKHGDCVEYPNEYQYRMEERLSLNHEIGEFIDDTKFHEIMGHL